MASQKIQMNEGERTRCEVWTRVMGYFRPVSFFNTGKKSEHYSRKHFQECVCANNDFTQKFGNQSVKAITTKKIDKFLCNYPVYWQRRD